MDTINEKLFMDIVRAVMDGLVAMDAPDRITAIEEFNRTSPVKIWIPSLGILPISIQKDEPRKDK